jgi:hypothetical protein
MSQRDGGLDGPLRWCFLSVVAYSVVCCCVRRVILFFICELTILDKMSSFSSSPSIDGTAMDGGSPTVSQERSVVGTARAQSPRTPTSRVGTARAPSPWRTPQRSSHSSKSPSSTASFATPPSVSSGVHVSPLVFGPPPRAVVIDVQAAQDQLFIREELGKPENTRKAIAPKVAEWRSYIDHVDPPPVRDHPANASRYVPTKANTYQFLLYQALRPKRKQGGKRKKREEEEGGDGEDSRGFDVNEYNSLMEQYSSGNGEALLTNPTNPIGVKLFDHYKMALQFVHSYYIQQRVSEESIFDPFIWGRDHKTLANIVKNRRLEISSAAFDEKMGTDATPYTQIDLLPKIEQSLWTMGKRLPRSQLAALRNRHAFLMTTAGILRFESLATRNLSEVFSFTWKGSRDVHDILITMYQLPEGKFLSVLFCCLSSWSHLCGLPFVAGEQVRLIRVFICLDVP